jgi:hypothetical protein
MSSDLSLSYEFTLPDGEQIFYEFAFDGQRHQLKRAKHSPPPWAQLHCQQCKHCPYKEGSSPKYCPAAVQLSLVVTDLDKIASFEHMQVCIKTPERTIIQSVSAQQAIGSLLGLLFASSGCPHTEFLLPMAKFHQPFSTPEETLWRASGSFLLAQYFRNLNNEKSESLDDLMRRYGNLEVLNGAMVKRLKNQVDTDSCLNAIILLDNYAKMYPLFLEKSLVSLRPLYESYFQH